MGEGLFGGVSGEEASNLGNAVGALDADEARLGDVGRIVAAHHVVDGALHGHLGQMRDHDHLMGARQVREHLREGAGRGAANAGVDLVEHERVDGVRLTEDHLGSEHDTRELAATGDTAQRTRRHAGTAAVQQLASGWALDGPALTCERLAVPHELGAAHLETRHLLAHLAAKTRRRGVPAFGQCPRGLSKLGLGGIAGVAGAPHTGLGVIDE